MSLCLSRPWRRYGRQSFGKYLPLAVGIPATEAADVQLDLYRPALPCQGKSRRVR